MLEAIGLKEIPFDNKYLDQIIDLWVDELYTTRPNINNNNDQHLKDQQKQVYTTLQHPQAKIRLILAANTEDIRAFVVFVGHNINFLYIAPINRTDKLINYLTKLYN